MEHDMGLSTQIWNDADMVIWQILKKLDMGNIILYVYARLYTIYNKTHKGHEVAYQVERNIYNTLTI